MSNSKLSPEKVAQIIDDAVTYSMELPSYEKGLTYNAYKAGAIKEAEKALSLLHAKDEEIARLKEELATANALLSWKDSHIDELNMVISSINE